MRLFRVQELYSYAFEFTHLMYTCIVDITSNKSTENESGENPYNEYCKKCHNFTMCFYKNYDRLVFEFKSGIEMNVQI